MQACLIVAGAYLVLYLHTRGESDLKMLCLLSALAGVALLTRLDSGLPFGLLFCFAAWSQQRHGTGLTPLILALALPVSVIVVPWLGWKLHYYHDILPNTYYLKAPPLSAAIFVRGLTYVYEFFLNYFLFPVVLVGVFGPTRLTPRVAVRLLLLLVTAWCIYVVKIGGDFMEFRMLVPILPSLFHRLRRGHCESAGFEMGNSSGHRDLCRQRTPHGQVSRG